MITPRIYGPPRASLVVVGQSMNAETGHLPHLAITGRCGERLAELAGVHPRHFYALVGRANVLPYWPGRNGSGTDRFPIEPARAGAEALQVEALRRARLTGRCELVLLGSAVARAFEQRGDLFEPAVVLAGPGRYALLAVPVPNPSGPADWWSRPENEARARAWWTDALERHAEGLAEPPGPPVGAEEAAP